MPPKNEDTLTSLIFDFLLYWDKFDYFNHEASIRMCTICPKKTYDPFFLEKVCDLTTVARNIKVVSQDRLRPTRFSTLTYLKWTKFDFTEFTNDATAVANGEVHSVKVKVSTTSTLPTIRRRLVQKKHFFSVFFIKLRHPNELYVKLKFYCKQSGRYPSDIIEAIWYLIGFGKGNQ
uniref:PAP-associated domain-containing protein n=1 Tax=Panagrellus redivivus TaxID=6233 RepID=A0A7E4W9H2_PANRE